MLKTCKKYNGLKHPTSTKLSIHISPNLYGIIVNGINHFCYRNKNTSRADNN